MKLRKQAVRSSIGIIIGIALIGHIIYTLSSNATLTSIAFLQFFEKIKSVLFILVTLLFLSNFIEILKWKLLISSQQSISWKQATISVLAGQAASFITPNRIGDYPARIFSLNNRLTYGTITLSIISASAQTLAILMSSEIALLLLKSNTTLAIFALLFKINSVIIIAMIFFYFRIEWLSSLFLKSNVFRKLQKYIQLVKVISIKLHLTAFIISLLKFLIYTTQLYVLLHITNQHVAFQNLFLLCVMYFWGMTIIPSIAYAELGIRNKWAIFLFSIVAVESWKIMVIITSLWLLNIVIPAIIGASIWIFKQSKNKWYAITN